MKKTIYTIVLIAGFAFVSQAQQPANTQKKAAPAKATQSVNPDGTLAPAAEASTESAVPQDDNQNKTEKKQGGTRMAITEKGVPASKKPAEKKKTEATKSEK
jgi:hypothetical protein